MKQIHPVKTVKLTVPKYVKDFKCIGSECPDTCCSGWRVTIDKSTYNAYKKISEPVLEKKISLHVARDRKSNNDSSYAFIKLNEDRSCPFLEEKLCSVQASKGGEYLSNTCHTYPRTTQNVSGRLEQQLTLSCPEAARLALTQADAFELDEIEVEERTDLIDQVRLPKGIDDTLAAKIRAAALMIVQEPTLDLSESMMVLGVFTETLDQLLQIKQLEKIEATIVELLSGVRQGLFKGSLNAAVAEHEFQATVLTNLFKLKRNAHKTKSFQSMAESVLKEQAADSLTIVIKDVLVAYKKGLEIINSDKAFTQRICKNYLSNEILLGNFPLSNKGMLASFVEIVIKLGIIRFIVALKLNDCDDSMRLNMYITTIQAFTKEYQHDADFKAHVQQLIKNNQLDNLRSAMRLAHA
jgi:lysine-N-methylase